MGMQSIKRALPLAMLVLLMASGCSLGGLSPKPPTPTQPPAAPTRRPKSTQVVPSVTPTIGPQVSIQGANFYLDPSLGTAAGGPVPADAGDVGSVDWSLPARFEFTVNHYPLSHTEVVPRIVVFPIAPLRDVNPKGVEVMKALAALIQDKTDPDKISGPIPQLTNPQDPEMFHTNIRYLDFKNGSGVRFVTQYASDVRPISNEDLTYHFVGITADGTYAVGVVLPLAQKDLVSSEDALTDAQANDMINDFTKYLTDASNELNIADGSTFKPTLSVLDKLAQSFEVTATTAPVVTVAPEDATPTSAPQPTPTAGIQITPAPTQ